MTSFTRFILASLIASAMPLGSACAMTGTSGPSIHCTVAGAEKLPAGVGGEDAVCSAIASAAAGALQGAKIAPATVSVAVTLKSDSRISAVPSVGGKALAEQNVATSDRALNANAITMLANAVAAAIAASAGQVGDE